MLKGADANDRLNVRIHPVAKARLVAYCEQCSVRGHIVTMTDHLNEHCFSLPPLPDGQEHAIEERVKQSKIAARERRRLKRKPAARASAA